ncbi:MAG: hypothetical protein IJ165_00720 [Proteobacteria bacterium]|nr:hypothetical protein [Pseudomonadota bacterium]
MVRILQWLYFFIPLIYLTLCLISKKKICALAQNLEDKFSSRILTTIAWCGILLLIALMMNSFIKVDDMKGFGWHPSRKQQKSRWRLYDDQAWTAFANSSTARMISSKKTIIISLSPMFRRL